MNEPIHFNNFSNGQGISEWETSAFPTLINCDVHSKPGTITASKERIQSHADGLIDSEVLCKAVVPNGDTFIGTYNGKIFKITPTGTITLVHTFTASAPVYGMDFLNDVFYYCSATKLGKIALANASSEASWSTQNDAWGTFAVGTIYKSMMKQNLSLFITDGYYIASVDNVGNFAPNVLDFEKSDISTALWKDKANLVIGGAQGTNATKAKLWIWDCFASSWSDMDEINERAVNCFIDADNTWFVSVGTIGNIYYWNGTQLVFWDRLKDDEDLVITDICPYASTNLNGLPLFTTNRGIFSLGRAKANLPIAKVIEYVSSQGQGVTSKVIASVGSQVFSSWKKTVGGTTYGIDKMGTDNADAIIRTPIAIGMRTKAKVRYCLLPAGTEITMKVKNDDGAFTSKTLRKDNVKERCYFNEKSFGNVAFMRTEIILKSNGATSPIIYDIEIE